MLFFVARNYFIGSSARVQHGNFCTAIRKGSVWNDNKNAAMLPFLFLSNSILYKFHEDGLAKVTSREVNARNNIKIIYDAT